MARRQLIEALGRVRPAPFAGTVYRQIALGYQALSGEGARAMGGRWNPPQSFPVLYTSPSVEVVVAEIARKARRAGFAPEDLMPRRLVTYEVDLRRVLDLSDEGNREATGFSLDVVTDDDIRICQAIGEAAHYIGLEGVLAPSAAAPGDALSIFLNKLLDVRQGNPRSPDALEHSVRPGGGRACDDARRATGSRRRQASSLLIGVLSRPERPPIHRSLQPRRRHRQGQSDGIHPRRSR